MSGQKSVVEGPCSIIFEVLVELFHYNIDPLELVKCIGSRYLYLDPIQANRGRSDGSWKLSAFGSMGQKTCGSRSDGSELECCVISLLA